jgi:hypothetical protein
MTDTFEPGSTIKPFTVALAMEKGQVNPNTVMTIGAKYLDGPNPITDTLTAIVSQDFAEVVPQTIATTGIQTNSDFAVQLAPFNDLTVGLTALGVFRPGFSTALQIGAQNMGSSDGASTVKLHLPENISIVSSSPNFTAQSGDTLIWTIPSLNFLESYPIQLIVYSSASAPLGWTVFCYTEISPIWMPP